MKSESGSAGIQNEGFGPRPLPKRGIIANVRVGFKHTENSTIARRGRKNHCLHRLYTPAWGYARLRWPW